MPNFAFIKSTVGLLPIDDDGKEWFAKLKSGAQVTAKVSVQRNRKFHRKFFAMLKVAYENNEWPEIDTPYGPAKTSAKMFRRYVTVKAGFFHMDVTPDGNFRPEAESIKFGKMEEAEFEKLYSAVLDVILQRFLSNWTRGDMDNAVDQILEFA